MALVAAGGGPMEITTRDEEWAGLWEEEKAMGVRMEFKARKILRERAVRKLRGI